MTKKAKTRPRAAKPARGDKRMASTWAPGGYILCREPIEANAGKEATAIAVANTGDRPIQVGSHFHFYEVNAALAFDRDAAYGMRLDIPAGTAVRFEPGQKKDVQLVALGGKREVWGLRALVQGALDR